MCIIYSEFVNAVATLEQVQLKGDSLLQVQLIKVADLSCYGYLVDCIAVPVILVDIGLKLKNSKLSKEVQQILSIHNIVVGMQVLKIVNVINLLWKKKDTIK